MEGLIFSSFCVCVCEFCIILGIVQSLSLEVFKIKLDKPMSNLVWPNSFEQEVE